MITNISITSVFVPYGVEAVARDNSGNWMVLVEERAFSAEDFG